MLSSEVMANDLIPFTGDRLSQARAFTGLSDEALSVRAVTAARDKDFAAL